MADALAVLGLQVDASGAISDLKRFESATTSAGAAASKTQGAVSAMAGGFKAADGTILGSQQALNRYEAALNKAANEQRRAAQAARELAIAEQAQSVAAAQATVATAAVGDATKSTEAAFNRIRGSLTGLLAPILGTVGGFNALTSTIGSLALGNVVTVGLLAGVAAIGVAYTALTEKTRKLREEQDKAIDALKRLRDEQKGIIGAETLTQIDTATSRLKELEAKLKDLRAQQNTQSVGSRGGIRTTGASTSDNRDLKKQIDDVAADIEAGRNRINELRLQEVHDAEAAKTAERVALLKGNAAIASDRKAAIDKLAFDVALLKKLNADAAKGADNASDRAQVVQEIKAYTDALNPSKTKEEAAARKALAAALREEKDAEEALIAAGERDRDRAKEFAKVGVDAVAALDKRIAAAKTLGDAETKRFTNAQAEVDALAFQVSLIGQSRAEVEKLTDAENKRLAESKGANAYQTGAIVEAQRLLRNQVDATAAWKDALSSVSGVVQSIAGAFGEVGRQIGSAIAAIPQLIDGLRKANAAQAAAKTAQGTSNAGAANSAATAATVASTASVFGAFLGLTSVFTTMQKRGLEQAKAARDAADALDELRASAQQTASNYALQANGSALDQTLARLKEGFLAVYNALAKAGGFNTGKFTPAPITFQTLQDAEDNYNKLVEAAKRAAAIQAKFAEMDLTARTLAATGHSAEAEAIRQQIADEKELEDARLAGADATKLATIAAVQAAEAIARAAKKAEDERRAIFSNTNGALAFTDPRAAGALQLQETAQNRLTDAVTRGASAAEIASIKLYNAAEALDYLARQAEQDQRTFESLVGRILQTLGNDRATQDFATAASQRQEIADAIREGMSPSNLAILRFTQFAENSFTQMQRAIEDGTKAIQSAADHQIAANNVLIDTIKSVAAKEIAKIDEQIAGVQAAAKETAKFYDAQIEAVRVQTKAQTDAIDAQVESARSQLDAANKTVDALDKQVQSNQKVVEALSSFSKSLKLGDLSTLSPEAKLAEARSQFEALVASAKGGNADAAGQIPGAANSLLSASRGFNASNAGFVADFNRVQQVVSDLTTQFGATLPIDHQALAAAKQTVVSLQSTIEILGKQKDAIQKASELQIGVLQKAKDKAAEDAATQIDNLNKIKDAITKSSGDAITKLESTNKAIQEAADAQIQQLIANETAAHQDRVRTYAAINGLSSIFSGAPVAENPNGPVNSRTKIQSSAPGLSLPAQQVDAAKKTNEKLDAVLTRLGNLLGVTTEASDDEIRELRNVVAAIRQGTQATQSAAGAAVARSSSGLKTR